MRKQELERSAIPMNVNLYPLIWLVMQQHRRENFEMQVLQTCPVDPAGLLTMSENILSDSRLDVERDRPIRGLSLYFMAIELY